MVCKNKRLCRFLVARLDYSLKTVYTESVENFIKKGGKNEKAFMYSFGVSYVVFYCGM